MQVGQVLSRMHYTFVPRINKFQCIAKLLIMSKCSTCVYYDGDDCEIENYKVYQDGRGCRDYEEDEDCGFTEEDLGIDQDEPWF